MNGLYCYPNGMSNEDLEYFDSPEDEIIVPVCEGCNEVIEPLHWTEIMYGRIFHGWCAQAHKRELAEMETV